MKKITTKEELNNFIAEFPNDVVVVKFSAGWCTPCRVLADTINSFTVGETAGVEFCEIDVDEADEELVAEYNIRNIPVLIFTKNGEVIGREVGLKTKEQILETISVVKNS